VQVSGLDALLEANRTGLAGPLGEQYARYVLVREDGRWWIAARQNTLVT
jgi:hypothetical protein